MANSILWTLPREDFLSLVGDSHSRREILEKLHLRAAGGNYKALNKRMQTEGVDLVSFDLKVNTTCTHHQDKIPLDQILVEGSGYRNRGRLKLRLLSEGLLENRCLQCGQSPDWDGKPLMLVLDHINGVWDDNRLENLRFLCPNCNSQTSTFCGRNLFQPKNCIDCGTLVSRTATRCRKCNLKCTYERKGRRVAFKANWPSAKDLRSMVGHLGYCEVGRRLGVSDVAVRKHLARHSV